MFWGEMGKISTKVRCFRSFSSFSDFRGRQTHIWEVNESQVFYVMYEGAFLASFKGELQRQNKLISSERPFKILQNETKIIKIGHAVLEIFNFKD